MYGERIPPRAFPSPSTAATDTTSRAASSIGDDRGGTIPSSAHSNRRRSAARRNADVGNVEPSPSQPGIHSA